MEIVYLGLILFLFVLAIFDLVVGVSNDAVNFLNSAIGSKVARFRTVILWQLRVCSSEPLSATV